MRELIWEDGSLNLTYLLNKIHELFPYVIGSLLMLLALVVLSKQLTKVRKIKSANLSVTLPKFAEGILFGKSNRGLMYYSPSHKVNHVGIWGGSGSGKTTSVLIPTLRAFRGNFFSIDISGDIRKNVQPKDAIIYKPEDINNPTTYNVFYAVDKVSKNKEAVNQELTSLSHLMFPDLPPDASDAASYFHYEARNVFTSALIAFYHKNMEFPDICTFIAESSYQELFATIDEIGEPTAIQLINRYEGNNEKNLSGVFQTLVSGISLFATNEYVKNSLRRNAEKVEFSPDTIETNSIFFEISDHLLEVYAPLVRLLLSQLFEHCSKRENYSTPHLLIAIDEMASFGNLDLLPCLRKFRKKNTKLLLCTQSLHDWTLLYGEQARNAMLNNVNFKVVLSATDYDTMLYFSKLTGKKEVKSTSISYGIKGKSTTESTVKEYSIEPEEFSKLGDKLVLLYPGGFKILKKNYFFKKSLWDRIKGVFK